MGDNTTRWTVTVSKETDIAVRSLLAQRGLKKGDLSKFIEDAVRWRVFDQTIAETRAGFADIAPEDLQDLIAEATEAVRNDMRQSLISTSTKEL
ncbi:ribbon-helix-helix domain-containing protein [Methylomagnum ishizawai]|uniref:ribbon-helix-helix domain-containing protein n=1 Tax=Methylomagnum ishizawai TaxID=1760988 RepID=UPI001C7F8FDF|nr:ribbon-helix-helix domain-containing protein [Methylomagnum ishizawai]